MTEEGYLDNCLSIAEDDDYKEKTRLAEVTATTLCRLNGIMKRMRGWRDDRVKLTSNIWRLKLALHVASKETNDTLHADPLIEHQRAEIKRLEADNQSLKQEIADIKFSTVNSDSFANENQEYLVEREYLNNEIQYLKSRLKEVEDGHEHNSEVEHLKCQLKHFMMVDHTMEIIFTDIVNKIAETIANLSEELVNLNDHLHRSKLKNNHLYVKIDRLKAMLRSKGGNILDYQKRITELNDLTECIKRELGKFKDNSSIDSFGKINLDNIERLAIGLKNKLRNDYEALLGAGDLDCLKYIQKIIELRINLREFHMELKSKENLSNCSRFNPKQLSNIESILKEINMEIGKLKQEHVKKNCRTVEFEGVQYLRKIDDLRVIIEKVRITISEFDGSNEDEEIEKLDDFVGRVCKEIKELEVIVVSNDRSVLLKTIERLENSLVELKVKSREKDQHLDALSAELFNMEELLKEEEREVDLLTEKNKALEEKALDVQREQECTRMELEQLQQVNQDINVTRKKLQNVAAENERLYDTLEERNQEMNVIVTEKVSLERELKTKIAELTRIHEENERLQNRVKEFEESNNFTNFTRAGEKRYLQDDDDEASRSKEALDIANREIFHLQIELEGMFGEKSKLETNICQLESKNEILVYELGVEKSIGEERLIELTKLKSDYNKLDIERMHLKNEKERLNTELINLTDRKEQLDEKCLKLENDIDKYRSECGVLREEARNFGIVKENLSAKFAEAEDKIRRLEFENSKLGDGSNDLSLKNISLEERVRVLLTEKNDLVTRINELDGKNVALKDQLNKVKTENEYSSVELNKLRTECDRARSANASLQNTLDDSALSNQALKKISDELKIKLNEIFSECRILENQLRILEIESSALKNEKDALQQRVNNLQSKISKMRNNGSKERKLIKKIDNETNKINKKSDKRVYSKIKLKEEKKLLTVENETLKFEVFNLKEQNFNIKMEMTRLKDELKKQKILIGTNESEQSNKLEIVNLYYKEINSYSSRQIENMGTLACINQSNICPLDIQSETEIERLLEVINKLKIENCALKMEVNTLRCNFLVNVTEDEKRWSEVRNTREEIRALKVELTKLREEKESLQNRLDTVRTKLDQSESEKAALKNELYALRKTNSELIRRANELQGDYQKVKRISEGFDSYVMGAIEKIKKYTGRAGKLEKIDEELKIFLEKYVLNEQFLHLIHEWEVNAEDT
ncbi:synaptonemal complex protein 1-like [Osmia bicornis bicornis]|uniref:synaptonemal complex protein 1-like n=1 Tax=Osmia bicornis bicornis TaxID=1437191 RepID=UPI001EAF32E1|nr:synaptonemal complex protein 1-like [Osmia bicornis bicornis]